MGKEKKVLAVVFSEEDLMRKIEDMKNQGLSESDLHLVSGDSELLDTLEHQLDAEGKRINTFKDKFKSYITGESSMREGVKSLGLNDQETERYTSDLAKGGILIYIEDSY